MAGRKGRARAAHEERRAVAAGTAPPRAPSAGAPAALRAALALAVAALSFLAFLPALWQGFVDLDDDLNFVQNPMYRGFSAENLRWMFTAFHVGHYQPLSWLTLALDWKLWGLDARGYHLTNLLLHALDTLLLYWLVLSLLRSAFGEGASEVRLRWCSAAAALIHGLHPLRAESVAWATERRDVLSACFLLLAVLAYLRRLREPQRSGLWLALSLAAYLASLFSKAWGITLPAVLLVLDVYPLRRLARPGRPGLSFGRLLAEKLWYAPFAALSALLAARAQGEAAAVVTLEEHGVVQRLVQACYGLWFYVSKTLWPQGLSALYILEREFDPTRPAYLAACAFVAGVTVALLVLRRRWPAPLAAWIAYGLLASPVLGLLQSGAQKVADRYTYLATMPFAALLGGGLVLAARRLGPGPRRALAGALAAVLVLLGGLAWRQTRTWRDSEALFRNMVAVEPHNYFAHHNLAVVLHRQGRYPDAIEHAQRSIEAHPEAGNVQARYNLALLYQKTGRRDDALAAMREALEVDPADPNTLRMLVREHLQRGEPRAAIDAVERSLERRPDFLEGYRQLAQLHRSQGRPEKANAVWERALAAAPDWPEARAARGTARLEAGRPAEAEKDLLVAVRGEPFNADYHVLLGRAWQALGRTAEAAGAWRQALALRPDHPQARALLQRAEAAGAGR